MPPSSFADPGELEALIAYVQTMIPPGSTERLVQKQRTIVVGRVAAGSPLRPTDSGWDGVPESEIVLSPMRWREEAVVSAALRAVHDGASIYLRVSWVDPTHDAPGVAETGPSDRAALQFTGDPDSSFFGMGTADKPVHIWYWHPQPARLTAGLLDLLSQTHGTMSDVSPVLSLPVRAQALVARGPGSAGSFSAQNHQVEVDSQWADGRWHVVFRRPLRAAGDALNFAPDATLRVAVAIWDGTRSESASDKSFSIWHRLVIE
jgi:hypothetical protein